MNQGTLPPWIPYVAMMKMMTYNDIGTGNHKSLCLLVLRCLFHLAFVGLATGRSGSIPSWSAFT